MRALLQRVSKAQVYVKDGTEGTFSGSEAFSGEPPRSIGRGYVVLLAVGKDDTEEETRRLWDKIAKIRLFPDERGKTSLSLGDVDGEVLLVSQFTLYADCKKGNRPNFMGAGAPDMAKRLFVRFVETACADERASKVAAGEFGADMDVSLVNDGPFTIWLDTDQM